MDIFIAWKRDGWRQVLLQGGSWRGAFASLRKFACLYFVIILSLIMITRNHGQVMQVRIMHDVYTATFLNFTFTIFAQNDGMPPPPLLLPKA